jgi:subtilisin family serine protease
VDLDGYASYEKVLAVATCNDRGKRSVYSDFGNAVFCSFPSNDFAFALESRPEPLTPGIWTVDRTGRAGYNPGPDTGQIAGDPDLKYTNGFGGTSSACPGAAGVAAPVIARNPALRWQEVKEILRQACDRIDPQGGAYDASGHSKKYGFGRLNAETAVRLALPSEGPATVCIKDKGGTETLPRSLRTLWKLRENVCIASEEFWERLVRQETLRRRSTPCSGAPYRVAVPHQCR